MDSKTANGVKELLQTSRLNDDKLLRITVGANCVCEYEKYRSAGPILYKRNSI